MIESHPLHKLRGFMLRLGAAVATALVLLTSGSSRGGQNAAPPSRRAVSSAPAAMTKDAALTAPQQKKEPENSNLEKTRSDAAELSALANQLRDDLNNMTIDVFPVDVIQKTDKVEKLAKKIKGEANAHLKLNSQRQRATP
jgi:hypothetical protein